MNPHNPLSLLIKKQWHLLLQLSQKRQEVCATTQQPKATAKESSTGFNGSAANEAKQICNKIQCLYSTSQSKDITV